MSLSPGTKLGPYEILAPLGAGGMGEVFRARDPRLSREVAIKVLPPSFAKDADRMRRFEQEARAAGILNHPNITSIHDFGTVDGSPYVVMELLEGDTLRNRLSTGPVPVRKAIDWAIQMARGLAAAHEKGIVHRDLKPENVFVTKDGRVKILDFGLAKLKEEKPLGSQTGMPTMVPTEPGVVLGTMGYMAPEQVRGQSADRRSDIFSFGAILYEMLSGQRAFRGDTAADTITAILTREPPDISQTNHDVHPGLDRIIRHCLEKNPEERFESARDLAFDLEALSGISTPRAISGAAVPPAAPRRRWMVPVATGLLGVALGVAGGLFAGKRMYERATPSFRQLTFRNGLIQAARFGPDGQSIYYSASWEGKPLDLYVTRLDSPESRTFGLPNAGVLSVSSSGEMAVALDSRAQGGFTRVGTLARLGITGGGAPREISHEVQFADWAPDGQALAIVRDTNAKARLEFPIGKEVYSTGGWMSHPRISPDGKQIAFLEHPVRGDDAGFVAIVDASGKHRALTDSFASAGGLCWSPRGNEVWFTASRVGFNRYLHAVSPSGRSRTLAEATGGLTLEDVSRDGRVLVAQDKARQGMYALAPGAEKETEMSWLDWGLPADITKDGSMILFDESGEGGGPGFSVYIRKLDGSPAVRLGEGSAQALSPDGSQAAVIVRKGDVFQVVLYPTGAGQPRTIPVEGMILQQLGWLADGKGLLVEASEKGRGIRLYTMDLEGGKLRAFSPEGYRLASLHVRPGAREVAVFGPDQKRYLYPIDGGEPTVIASLRPRENIAGWSADGKSLFVRLRDSSLPAVVESLDLATGKRERMREIRPADASGVTGVGAVRVTPDGKAYAYSFVRNLADLYVVEGLK
jgi:Tol biopolymer transport system component